ncbi:hypothetical protein OSTOST_22167 [Ostertagia ostertagi]
MENKKEWYDKMCLEPTPTRNVIVGVVGKNSSERWQDSLAKSAQALLKTMKQATAEMVGKIHKRDAGNEHAGKNSYDTKKRHKEKKLDKLRAYGMKYGCGCVHFGFHRCIPKMPVTDRMPLRCALRQIFRHFN